MNFTSQISDFKGHEDSRDVNPDTLVFRCKAIQLFPVHKLDFVIVCARSYRTTGPRTTGPQDYRGCRFGQRNRLPTSGQFRTVVYCRNHARSAFLGLGMPSWLRTVAARSQASKTLLVFSDFVA